MARVQAFCTTKGLRGFCTPFAKLYLGYKLESTPSPRSCETTGLLGKRAALPYPHLSVFTGLGCGVLRVQDIGTPVDAVLPSFPALWRRTRPNSPVPSHLKHQDRSVTKGSAKGRRLIIQNFLSPWQKIKQSDQRRLVFRGTANYVTMRYLDLDTQKAFCPRLVTHGSLQHLPATILGTSLTCLGFRVYRV